MMSLRSMLRYTRAQHSTNHAVLCSAAIVSVAVFLVAGWTLGKSFQRFSTTEHDAQQSTSLVLSEAALARRAPSNSIHHPYVDNSTPANTAKGRYDGLVEQIQQLLTSPPLRRTRFGLVVYSLDRDTTLFSRGAQELLVPASLTKLYYTAAAYATMGPTYPVRTVLATDGAIHNGTLTGNLYIIGHGDCLLTVSELEVLAEKLRALGVRRVRGSIIADASYFDPITDRQEYSGDAERMENLPLITALGLEGNRITVLISRAAGNRARVQTFPAGSGISVQWSAIPSLPSPKMRRPSRKRQRYGDLLVMRQKPRRSRRTAAIQPVRVTSTLTDGGVQQIHVLGMPRTQSSVSVTVTMLNPPLVVAGAFERCLTASGIAFDGRVTTGATPSTVTELAAWERPISALVEQCNKNSDNFIAEHVMKILGAYCCGNTQCNVHAYRTVAQLLDTIGVPSDGCVLYDGSGLSRRNRVTVTSLIGLLRYSARQPWGEQFFNSLSVAGQEGTLLRRMRRTPAENNLRAKTGTHRNVSGLAGIVRSTDGERLLFAALWNGNSVGFYKSLENSLGELLAGFGGESLPTTDSPIR
ncbi:MAG: D-alanyl-D-alanine carboxypeptidase [Candidatus Kapaibacterium sp.]|nr:MAG: D-alanyl-D-alanine carboxypeptidase [Candidatus Kapabacteria bacterium]